MRAATLVILGMAIGLLAGGLWAFEMDLLDHQAGSVYFPDCSADSPHDDDIGWLVEAGVTQGYPNGTYGPEGLVTRGQMASYVARSSAQDMLSTWYILDLFYHEGYLFGPRALNEGRITEEEFLHVSARVAWARELITAQCTGEVVPWRE